jgi:3-phenylpropionate/trans-cinnamate dioxygenase ferredoxin reductase component
MTRRIVIVGNGIAGLTVADSLRAAGHDGELTIVGDERHAAYSRPALSKAMLHGEDLTAYHLPSPTHGATELLGVAATALDGDRRTVALDDGSTLPYDALAIATGSRARRLGDDTGELTLRTLDDAIALRARLAHRPSVVVVGGGALGMEIASSCLTAGCPVTMVSRGRPLLHQLGPFLADVFVTAALERGLTLVETRSAQLRPDGAATKVILGEGSVLEADVVVTAVGDLHNVKWLAATGLLRGGVLEVDSRGRARPDIVAVGDVAAFPTRRGVRRVPLWTSAIDQSKIAAAALLRGDQAPALDFRPYFWTEQFGLTLKAAGFLPLPGPPAFIDGDSTGGRALMRWAHPDGSGTAVALNYRIPIPRLRRVSEATAA